MHIDGIWRRCKCYYYTTTIYYYIWEQNNKLSIYLFYTMHAVDYTKRMVGKMSTIIGLGRILGARITSMRNIDDTENKLYTKQY